MNMEDNKKMNAESEQQKPEKAKKVQLIHNPLPGPKPHVKKQMNYDYNVLEDQMHYDVEVDENDDYDLP